MRIVQLANFWTPTSGGLRVVLEHLAQGYADRGHKVCQIVPGPADSHSLQPWGRRTTVAAPTVPGTGYRMIVRLRHTERLVEAFGADVVEVSDRATLLRAAARFRDRNVRTVLVAHERLDHILPAGGYGDLLFDSVLTRKMADGWNLRCGAVVDEVVVPSRYGAEEWQRVGVAPRIVPWGVDVERFHPDDERHRTIDTAGRLELVWVGRLSTEKRPHLAIAATRTLVALGVDARLTMVGDGPLAGALRVDAADDPVDFTGHVSDHSILRGVVARASVSLSTSGIEAFGLTVLESLACGTPVVSCSGGAAGEVAGSAGRIVAPTAEAIAAGVLAVAADPVARDVARRRAARFGWDAATESMLAIQRGDRRSGRAA